MGVTSKLRSLESSSSTLVLVGGISLAGHGAITAIEAFTSMSTPPDVFAPVGYLLATLGLLGLVPGLVGDIPRLGRAAALAGSIAVVGWVAVLAEMLASAIGVASPIVSLPDVVWLPVVLSTFGSYLLFALATRLSRRHTGAASLLLLAPPVLVASVIVGGTVLGPSAVGILLIGTGQCIAHLSLGVVLRGSIPGAATPTTDTASTG